MCSRQERCQKAGPGDKLPSAVCKLGKSAIDKRQSMSCRSWCHAGIAAERREMSAHQQRNGTHVRHIKDASLGPTPIGRVNQRVLVLYWHLPASKRYHFTYMHKLMRAAGLGRKCSSTEMTLRVPRHWCNHRPPLGNSFSRLLCVSIQRLSSALMPWTARCDA